jgi:hypothetical protein
MFSFSQSQMNVSNSSTPCKWPNCPASPTTAVPASPPNSALHAVASIAVTTIRRHHYKPVAAVDNPALLLNRSGGNRTADGLLLAGDMSGVKFPSRALPYVVGVLFSLAIVVLIIVGVWKCVAARWPSRAAGGQYRKMDFLIDGMYDT